MIEKVVRIIDDYVNRSGESPTTIGIHPKDWSRLYTEARAEFHYGPATNPEFPERYLFIKGVKIVQDPYKERI